MLERRVVLASIYGANEASAVGLTASTLVNAPDTKPRPLDAELSLALITKLSADDTVQNVPVEPIFIGCLRSLSMYNALPTRYSSSLMVTFAKLDISKGVTVSSTSPFTPETTPPT